MFDILLMHMFVILLAQALFRHLEWRYHGVPWPSASLTPVDLVSHFVKRINEASVSRGTHKHTDTHTLTCGQQRNDWALSLAKL